jgi:flavin-dependent dehydrogenase
MTLAAEVIVVGGGLTGSATALHLAALGRDVLVLERDTFPREKVCGEGMMPHGVAELERLGALERILATNPVPFRGIRYHAHGVTALGTFPGGRTGLGVRRSRIDAVMHELCAAHPRIVARTGVRVTDIAVHPDHVVVHTSEGPVAGSVLVGADGLNSLVRRKLRLGKPPRGPKRYGARLHLKLSDAAPRLDRVEVFLEGDLEIYLTPTAPDEINVAILCGPVQAQRWGGDLHAAMYAQLASSPTFEPWLSSAEILTQATLWGPLRQETRHISHDRAVLVGDAAGFVDALTGEGMSVGLISARLAAYALHDALRAGLPSARTLRAYDRARARHARSLSLLTELLVRGIRVRGLARWVVGNLARHPGTFDRVLAVNIGERPLWRVPARDVARIAIGL